MACSHVIVKKGWAIKYVLIGDNNYLDADDRLIYREVDNMISVIEP